MFDRDKVQFLRPLEWTNLFGPSNKVVYLKKLVFGSGVRFSILFVLVDAILLSLDLQKRTSYKIFFSIPYTFVSHFCTIYPKFGDVFCNFDLN